MRGFRRPVSQEPPFTGVESRTDEMHFVHTHGPGPDGQCPKSLPSPVLNLEQTKCILSTPTDCGHFPYFPHAKSLQGGIYTSKMAVTYSSYFY